MGFVAGRHFLRLYRQYSNKPTIGINLTKLRSYQLLNFLDAAIYRQSIFHPLSLRKLKISGMVQQEYPNHIPVALPSLSPTMTTGKIVSWKKSEGDYLEEGDVIAEIETDKAIVPLETPKVGYLAKILVPEGSSNVQLKELIAVIVKDKNDILKFKNFKNPKENMFDSTENSEIKTVEPINSVENLQSLHEKSKLNESSVLNNHLKVTPLAKNLSKQYGVDLKNVVASTPIGRITSVDVSNFVKNNIPSNNVVNKASDVESSFVDTYIDIELTNIRKTIAKRLVESKQNIPHYYLLTDIHMDEVIKLKNEFNSTANEKYKLSLNDFVIKAAALALKHVPECNSSFLEHSIRRYSNVDISVAVNTDHGLITPIVFNADQKGLIEINKTIKNLAEKAKSRTIQPSEYIGGTFSVSNLGMFGIKSFTAVINPPQSCILAVGSIHKRPIYNEIDREPINELKWGSFMTVTLSCDHRVVDGAVGANYLKHLNKYIENPMSMLL